MSKLHARQNELMAQEQLSAAVGQGAHIKSEDSGYNGSVDTTFIQKIQVVKHVKPGSSSNFLREIELRRKSSIPLLAGGSIRQKVKCKANGRTVVEPDMLDDYEGMKVC